MLLVGEWKFDSYINMAVISMYKISQTDKFLALSYMPNDTLGISGLKAFGYHAMLKLLLQVG